MAGVRATDFPRDVDEMAVISYHLRKEVWCELRTEISPETPESIEIGFEAFLSPDGECLVTPATYNEFLRLQKTVEQCFEQATSQCYDALVKAVRRCRHQFSQIAR